MASEGESLLLLGETGAEATASTASSNFLECVSQYKDFRQGMCMTRGDPEVDDLYQIARDGAIGLAAQLNALVGVTADVSLELRDPQRERDHNNERGEEEEDEDEDRVVILFPASAYQKASAVQNTTTDTAETTQPLPWPTSITTNCPFEIFYDDREWLPCVILEVKPPTATSPGLELPPPPAHSRGGISAEEIAAYDADEGDSAVALWRYTVGILGYNTLVEEVNALSLRPFTPDPNLLASLASGRRCSAVHPGHHADFRPCTIQRLTVNDTVFVTFEENNKDNKGFGNGALTPSAPAPVAVELPLSHIHLGKVYKSLQRIHQLTPEERERRRAELAARKRERAEAERKAAMGRVATAANEWKATLNDLMFTGGASSTTSVSTKSKKSGATGNIKRRPR